LESLKRLEVSGFRSDATVLEPTVTISKVLSALRDLDTYEVFIPQGDKVGMITARDLISTSNLETKVGTLLKYVPKLSPQTHLSEAARIMMDYRIRALPIVEDGEITGEVKSLSILKAMTGLPPTVIKARNIMTANPLTISEEDQVSKARNLMVKRRIDHLPALDGHKLTGILTSNLIAASMVPPESVRRGIRGLEEQKKLNFPVKDLMNRSISTCDLDDDALTVLKGMLERQTTYALVTLWGEELQGIITHRDYVKLLAEVEEEEVPIYIIGLPDAPFEAEVAKTKFRRAINLLKRSFPYIEEARSIIKVSTPTKEKERRRYEVKVAVKTTKQMINYSETGWDLPQIFDVLTDRMKRLLTQKPTRKATPSQRKETEI